MDKSGGPVYPQFTEINLGTQESPDMQFYPTEEGITRRQDMVKTFIAAILSNPNFVTPGLGADMLDGTRGGAPIRRLANQIADNVLKEEPSWLE